MEFNEKQFTRCPDGTLVAEASDLQLKSTLPRLQVRGSSTELSLFQFDRADFHNGEVTGWRYRSNSGGKLLIIND